MAAAEETRRIIAARAALELRDGMIANLGIGIPVLVADYVPAGVHLILHGENGVVGAGPTPAPGAEDQDRMSAANLPITLIPGGCYVDSVQSFGLIRGGHLNLTMLGTLEVDSNGNIANHETSDRKIGMGGAMDLVVGAETVYILTEHCNKYGDTKLVRSCTLPITGEHECDVIITERALFRRHSAGHFVLEEVAEGYSIADIADCTDLNYTVSEHVETCAYGQREGVPASA